jgi:class 3 adenylate cyclase
LTRRRAAVVLLLGAPIVLVAVLRAQPSLDGRWENHPAHFWLVLAAAAIAVALGLTVTDASRRRRDGRLFLISLAFVASAGFLGLHALATPGVLLGKNAGFELATPFGLVVAGALAAGSALELHGRANDRVMRAYVPALASLVALLGLWALVSLTESPPLDAPIPEEELDGWQVSLALIGVAFYGLAALGYLRLYRRRRAAFVFGVALALALLAEAMVVIAWASNWQLSWWEWHVLMLFGFGLVAYTARREWHEERFSALYLDETLRGARDVSILFADLEGFTAYSERHSPAEVGAMLNAYFERVVPLIEREHGAEVHQLIGDAVMAIFNKAGDQPDHAVRAARAGLALQREASRCREGHEDWPRFRVGINSGEVLAGVVGAERGHRKHGVVGDTVNLAARLEGEAMAGEVVVGAETYRRLPDGTEARPLAGLQVKGKSAPVEAFVLASLPD